ncbi:outer membrane protein assembly factor BamE [Thiococcus pfennigii]|uniref:outer membrane protein assembly factor BamE n=1 Tax=Thiococcus pfennigii TaxID=1057 RepID=UPI001907A37B|nr:outer membrane protein assembly factor BamE [Thiococcus pfennigii]MBK1700349.1 cell envelope protein SmpA [Thiococcus pfennigii]MBK1731837.1 cell envelope protein SmpA [Thiococcus pfennigii]
MQKIITFLVLGLSLGVLGCSSKGQKEPVVEDGSALERLPFVYKMPVQQGNIITEDMVDSLRPGMTKRQVRFLLGTPLLVDFFHADRWDYTYTLRRGHEPMETKRLTLFFEDDALARIEGDMRPDPQRAADQEPEALIVTVPDWEDRRGLFKRTIDRVKGEKDEQVQ